MTEPALRVSSLSRRYRGRPAVDQLDLEVPAGAIYGFLGPNGAGKTTTLRLLLGLVRPDAGQIAVFGETDTLRRRTQMGGIVEAPRLWPYLSGETNLSVFAAYGPPPPRGRIDEVLERVRLRDRARDKVRTYSLGMKQRLAIAMALLHSPRLLLLDEPTNGLDPAGIREVRDLIRSLRDEAGITVFISSHLLGEVEKICDRVGIVREGRKIAEGTPLELAEPGESLEDAFLRLTGGLGGQIR